MTLFYVISLCFLLILPKGVNGADIPGLESACTAADTCTETDAVCDTTQSKCKKKVGVTCTADSDECVSGATCPNTGTEECTCDIDHVPDTTNGVCLKKVGQTCTRDSSECVNGATCPNTGTAECTCDTDHVHDTTNRVCLKNIGQPCTEDAQCIKATGVVCSTTCSCDTKYVTGAAGDTSCKLKADEICTDTTPCTTNAVCSNENTRTCTCSTGYVKQSSGTCRYNDYCALHDKVVLKAGQTGCTDDDKCTANSVCTTGTCTCSANYIQETSGLCSGVAGLTCSVFLLGIVLLVSKYFQ